MISTARNGLPAASWNWAAWAFAGAVVSLVLFTHLGSVEAEMPNWDETTFIVMANDVGHGHLPYVHQFDIKPPGIFLLLAGAFALLGKSLWVVRLVGILSTILVALFTFDIARRLSGSFIAGLSTLALAAVMSLPFGQFTVTELPAAACLMAALWLMMRDRGSLLNAALVGLFMSLATLTRLNLAIPVVAVGIYFALAFVRPAWRPHRLALLAYVAGGLLPLGLVLLVYGLSGKLQLALLAIFAAPLSYASNQLSFLEALRAQVMLWAWFAAKRHPAIFAPLSLLIALGGAGLIAWLSSSRLRAGQSEDQFKDQLRDVMLLAAVGFAVVLSLLWGGAVYDHYLLQVLPFAAILIAVGVAKIPVRPIRALAHALCAAMVLVSVVTTAPAFWRVVSHPRALSAHRPLRMIADQIRTDRQPGDKVWPLTKHLLLWYLDQPSISYAVHPSLIARPAASSPLIKAGLIHEDEFSAILNSTPKYIEVGAGPDSIWYLSDDQKAALQKVLALRYEKWLTRDDVIVYRRRDSSGATP